MESSTTAASGMSTSPRPGESTFGFLVNDVARLLRKRFDRQAATLELTRSQWSVLFHLSRCEGTNQTALAARLEIEPISLTRILDRMERNGWVERRPDPQDRRARRLHLTERARPVLARLQELAAETRAEALTGISSEDHDALLRILAAIKTNLVTLIADDGTNPTSAS